MKQSIKNNHNWSREGNIVALYYYRFGVKFLGLNEKEIATLIGRSVDSLKSHSKKFEMLDTGKSALSDYSQIQSDVFNEFGKSIRYTLFREVKKVLDLDKRIMERMVKAKTLKGFRKLTPVVK